MASDTQPNNGTFYVRYTVDAYKVNLVELPSYEATYNLSSHSPTDSTAYDIFTIPYGDIVITTPEGDITTSKSTALTWAASIAINGETNVYDMQILPYCPIDKAVVNNKLDLSDEGWEDRLKYLADSSTTYGVLIFAESPDVNKRIHLDITNEEPVKVQALCDKYRLVSPNYSGQFEFNAVKNGGIGDFDVDMTMKPFAPYIHINPDFGNLYGRDYNDARGLVCGGDFSLPIVSDAWKQYQINNKTYNEAFDRQIQNMETVNNITRTKEIWGAIAGTASGAISGATTGGIIGGGYGAALGGVVGGGMSLAAGIADVQLNDQLRNETLDYTKDQFGYNLQNIKALPYSLSKVGALNANNKIWPILEYYTCTEEEKQALKDKVKYNGMTVMRIGNIRDYVRDDPSYIKGKLIRYINDNSQSLLDCDYHLATQIADEINKGV